jgi:DNA-binding CsgD family transcriptional regulator
MLVLTMDYAPGKGERLNGPAARLAQVLAPHLRRSFELSHQLAQSQSDAPASVLGRMKAPTLVVDERRRLHYANPAAEALLGARSGLHLDKAGRVALEDGAANVELERSVQTCVRPELAGSLRHAICFRARGGEASQWISALPLTPDKASSKSDVVMFFSPSTRLVMLIISQTRDPADDLAQFLRSAFRLTPAEIRLALALMQGISLQEHAASNSVAVMTVRNQLQSIFGKTSTHRQAELTALLFSLPGNWTTRSAGAGSVQSASRPGGSTRTRLMLALFSVLNWCPWVTDSFLAALV